MKKVIISLFFVITGTFLFAQTPKAYALNDSLAATKENQVGLKYLAGYLPILDSLWHLKDSMVVMLPIMKNRVDSLGKEFVRYRLFLDTLSQRVQNKEPISDKFIKKRFARYQEMNKALTALGNELDSMRIVVKNSSDIYTGLVFFSRVRMRQLIGPSYDRVVEDMDFDEVFTLKGKTIFVRRHLETYCF